MNAYGCIVPASRGVVPDGRTEGDPEEVGAGAVGPGPRAATTRDDELGAPAGAVRDVEQSASSALVVTVRASRTTTPRSGPTATRARDALTPGAR